MARPPSSRRADRGLRAFYLPPWRIDILHRPGVRSPVPNVELARLAGRALTSAGAPAPGSLALILSGDSELAALNARHMGEDGPTDVLSFPLLPPSAFPGHEGKEVDVAAGEAIEPAFEPPRARVHLGDIVISIERAKAQAPDSFVEEVQQLAVHGVLHICGWDHADPVENAAMRAVEREVLEKR